MNNLPAKTEQEPVIQKWQMPPLEDNEAKLTISELYATYEGYLIGATLEGVIEIDGTKYGISLKGKIGNQEEPSERVFNLKPVED